MHCPHCACDINDDHPECPRCAFHIRDLDEVFGPVPERSSALVDLAGAVDAESRTRLLERLDAFQAATRFELVAVVVADTGPRLPAEHAFWLFNRWGVGGQGHGGVLVLLALAERRVEVEVGFSLEHIFSDAVATSIVTQHGVPFFQAGRHGEGLVHACGVLTRVIEMTRR